MLIRSLMFAAFLGSVSFTAAQAQEDRTRPEREVRVAPDQDAAPAAPAAQAPEWEFQGFARGVNSVLAGGGDLAFRLDSTDPGAAPVSRSYSGMPVVAAGRGFGVGIRALRGAWGAELQHHRITGEVASLVSLIKVAQHLDTSEVAGSDLNANLFLAQGIFRIGGEGRVTFSLGFGGGYALLSGDGLDQWPLGNLPIEFSAGGEFGGDLLRVWGNTSASGSSSDRGSFVVGGSAALTVHLGRFLIRPRIDIFATRTRRAEERWAFDFGLELPGYEYATGGSLAVETGTRPAFVLLSVDVGLSSGR